MWKIATALYVMLENLTICCCHGDFPYMEPFSEGQNQSYKVTTTKIDSSWKII